MPKDRLNISVERSAIERGRRYSQRHRTSISRLVGDFLASLPVEGDREQLTPTVRRLLGVARGSRGLEDYHRYLPEKYGS